MVLFKAHRLLGPWQRRLGRCSVEAAACAFCWQRTIETQPMRPAAELIRADMTSRCGLECGKKWTPGTGSVSPVAGRHALAPSCWLYAGYGRLLRQWQLSAVAKEECRNHSCLCVLHPAVEMKCGQRQRGQDSALYGKPINMEQLRGPAELRGLSLWAARQPVRPELWGWAVGLGCGDWNCGAGLWGWTGGYGTAAKRD